MQWDKVKNILIAILLTINLFLLGNLAVRGWQSHRRTSELEANLRTLVSARGMQLDTALSVWASVQTLTSASRLLTSA